MTHPAYRVFLPERQTTSVVFASPHSGSEYPAAFLRRSVLDQARIRSSEDAYIDELFATAPDHGAPLLAARAPRCFIDMNRGPDELDPALIRGVRRLVHNPRVASGLGVIPRVVAGGREIYRGKLSLAEAEARLEAHWRPYHAQVQAMLDASHARFGEAILIDCHSMPHEAIETLCRAEREKPEVVIGDRFGASAGAGVVERIEAAFRAAGFRVARNAPFAGAYTAQHYGRPSRGQHVVQVEIDRSLYMDEASLARHDGFGALRDRLTGVIAALAAIGRPAPEAELPLAAE